MCCFGVLSCFCSCCCISAATWSRILPRVRKLVIQGCVHEDNLSGDELLVGSAAAEIKLTPNNDHRENRLVALSARNCLHCHYLLAISHSEEFYPEIGPRCTPVTGNCDP